MNAAKLSARDGSAEVAAVDLGSNSFHMMIARREGAGLRVIDRLREPVRLAGGLGADKRLAPATQAAALACLRRFGQRLRHLPRERVRVVGTSTLRRMRHSATFIAAAEQALGHPIEIISGAEEARLVYAGVTHDLGNSAPRRLVVDIGGGSTELIIGRGAVPKLAESVSLGCVTHTQLFFGDGKISADKFARARLAARVRLESFERDYRRAGWDVAIGSSGTIRGVWRVLMSQGGGEHITRAGLEKLIETVIARKHVRKIDFAALREDRRPVFVGGLAVLAGVFDALQIKRMQTSEFALREGVTYDLLGRLSNRDVRGRSVVDMAQRHALDATHARQVARTAQRLLEQLGPGWQLDRASGAMLLGWAAQLHEIGQSISHNSHNKHGEYILRHCDLPGFSQADQLLLATLVRLHRGKLASTTLDLLPPVWRQPILQLTLILRLAVLLHRAREPATRIPVRVRTLRKTLEVGFTPANWLTRHPLTRADLERESEYLAAIGIQLRIETD